MAKPAAQVRQLWPEDKFPFGGPFSYTKAIIKDDVDYPIVPNCPIINVDDTEAFDVSNIPAGTFFIIHFQMDSSRWTEYLCLRVPADTVMANWVDLLNGSIVIGQRRNYASSGGWEETAI